MFVTPQKIFIVMVSARCFYFLQSSQIKEVSCVCPQSNISHIGAFVFISPDYEYIKNRILRRKPVSDSQEFTDLRGNVLYSVSVWDMDRDNDELDLYQPDGFWIQRVTLKTNHATGDDFSHEYEFICAPSPPPPREHQHFGMFQL